MFSAEVRKLLLGASLLRKRSRDLSEKTGIVVVRNRARVSETRGRLALREQRPVARSLRTLISDKLDEGMLPEVNDAIFYGAPGVGGHCDACGGPLAPSQLVMSVAQSGEEPLPEARPRMCRSGCQRSGYARFTTTRS
jgi:hypothetical protein